MIIGYFGDGPWAHNALDLISARNDIKVSFVCGRFKSNDFILEEKAKELKIDFFKEENVNSDKFKQKLKKYDCDLFVSMSFNQIFKKLIYELPKLGTINCHAGKLPMYRGRNVLNWVLINDEKEFGITVHYIDDGIDTGDIILQETFPINDLDDYKTILEKAYEECPRLLLNSILKIKNNVVLSKPQNSLTDSFMYCSKRINGDEIINWNSSSRDIFNFIRALTYPGPCAISYDQLKPVKILKSVLLDNSPTYKGIPGSVLEVNRDSFIVKTKDSHLKILKWESNRPIYRGLRFNKGS